MGANASYLCSKVSSILAWQKKTLIEHGEDFRASMAASKVSTGPSSEDCFAFMAATWHLKLSKDIQWAPSHSTRQIAPSHHDAKPSASSTHPCPSPPSSPTRRANEALDTGYFYIDGSAPIEAPADKHPSPMKAVQPIYESPRIDHPKFAQPKPTSPSLLCQKIISLRQTIGLLECPRHQLKRFRGSQTLQNAGPSACLAS